MHCNSRRSCARRCSGAQHAHTGGCISQFHEHCNLNNHSFPLQELQQPRTGIDSTNTRARRVPMLRRARRRPCGTHSLHHALQDGGGEGQAASCVGFRVWGLCRRSTRGPRSRAKSSSGSLLLFYTSRMIFIDQPCVAPLGIPFTEGGTLNWTTRTSVSSAPEPKGGLSWL